MLAEHQEEFMPLAVALYQFAENGSFGVLTRFTFTPDERQRVAAGEDIYIMQLVGPKPQMTPMSVYCGPPELQILE